MQLETRDSRFGRKGLTLWTTSGESTGNPARLLTFGTAIQLGDQGDQCAGIVRTHEASEVLTGHLLRSTAERFFRGRVHADDMELIIQLDDGIHGTAEKSPDFFFPLAHLRFRPQAL